MFHCVSKQSEKQRFVHRTIRTGFKQNQPIPQPSSNSKKINKKPAK